MPNILEKQGYKYTEEFGYIPEDWEVTALGDNINYFKGYAFKSSSYTQDGTRIIRVSDMSYDDISDSEQIFISKLEANELSKYALKENDVIITTVGSKPPVYTSLVGRAIQVKQKDDGSLLNQNAVCLRTKNKLKQRFLFYIFKQKYYMEFLEQIIRGNANQGSITLENLFELPVLCPPVEEQEKIAEVFGNVDSLIDKTQQLINKKKDLKTATMQKLFKNKDKFQQVNLPNIVWFQEGPGIRTWQFTKSGMKVINVTNLENGYLNLDKTDRHISMEEYHSMYEHFSIDENDIVMASSGNSYSKVAVARKQDLPLLMNTSVIRFKPLDGITYNYLLTFLRSFIFKDQIDLLITGGAQPNFGPAHLKKIFIPLPKIEEQNRIATILSDMDSEIEALEKELNKYKDLKTGMMQQLLTGKVRLI